VDLDLPAEYAHLFDDEAKEVLALPEGQVVDSVGCPLSEVAHLEA